MRWLARASARSSGIYSLIAALSQQSKEDTDVILAGLRGKLEEGACFLGGDG